MGSFIWPAAIRLMLELYGFRGTILLMGAIFLHAVPFAALYLPPYVQRKQCLVAVKVLDRDTRILHPSMTGSLTILKASSMMDLNMDHGLYHHEKNVSHNSVTVDPDGHQSLQNLDLYDTKMNSGNSNTHAKYYDCEKLISGNKLYVIEKEDPYETKSLVNVYGVARLENKDNHRAKVLDSHTKDTNELHISNNHDAISNCNKLKEKYSKNMLKIKHTADFLGLTLLNSGKVWLLFLGFFFQTLGMLTPTFFLPAKLAFMDSASIALLVGIIGITDTMGRLLFGAIGSATGANPLLIFTVLSALAGISSMLSTVIVDTFINMAIYTSFYGFVMGKFQFSFNNCTILYLIESPDLIEGPPH